MNVALTREPSLLELHLDEFLDAYIEAAFFSSNDESDDRGGEPLDKNYDESDLANDARARMREDCVRFLDACAEVIARAKCDQARRAGCSVWAMAGHDLWFTRNGHGVGFWETPDWDEASGELLTEASKRMGEVYLYVGDDGKVHHG